MHIEKVVYSVKWDLLEGIILITPSMLNCVILHTFLFSFLGQDYTSLFNDIRLAYMIYSDQSNMNRRKKV